MHILVIGCMCPTLKCTIDEMDAKPKTLELPFLPLCCKIKFYPQQLIPGTPQDWEDYNCELRPWMYLLVSFFSHAKEIQRHEKGKTIAESPY